MVGKIVRKVALVTGRVTGKSFNTSMIGAPCHKYHLMHLVSSDAPWYVTRQGLLVEIRSDRKLVPEGVGGAPRGGVLFYLLARRARV